MKRVKNQQYVQITENGFRNEPQLFWKWDQGKTTV
jgi:hypothetical protein